MIKKDFAKTIGFNSDGIVILLLQQENKILVFNADKCELIAGTLQNKYTWFTNCLKLFAPVEYSIEKEEIILDFTLEKLMFKAKRDILSECLNEIAQEYEVAQ